MEDAANTPLAETGMPLGKKIVMVPPSSFSSEDAIITNIVESRREEKTKRSTCRHGLSVPVRVQTVGPA
jgi:hypothetical protein